MKSRSRAAMRGALFLHLAVAAAPGIVQAQPDYPAKTVRAVLPYSVGSGPDAVVRQVGEKLAREWGRPVVIENKPGANGWLAVGDVKRASADGYTLLTVDATHMTLQPQLYKQLPYDPIKDFEPVAPLYTTQFFVVVSADSPLNNVSELISAAKAKSGLTYGTWGIGSVAHVGTAMLEAATGVSMTHVPFKDLQQLYMAVAAGDVGWAFGTAATVRQLYQAKKVKLLAYAGSSRLAGYEHVPTVSEAGGPTGFELGTWVALYAPKGIPKATVDRISSGIAKALVEPEVRERFAAFGFDAWIGGPTEVGKAAQADAKRYADVVKRANITLD